MKNKNSQIKPNLIYILLNAIAISLLLACSTTKYIPDGQYLLDNVSLKTDSNIISKTSLAEYIQQKPNSPKFGLMLYNLVKSDSGWLRKTIRKLGEPPVIFNQKLVNQSVIEMSIEMKNHGYFNSYVDVKLDTVGKKIRAEYHIHEGSPYRIRNYTITLPNAEMDSIALGIRRERARIDSLPQNTQRRRRNFSNPFSTQNRGTLIKEGAIFDMQTLEQEMTRISGRLRNSGYYKLDVENLHYLADTALQSNQVDLNLHFKDSADTQVYRIGKINVYSGLNPFDKRRFMATDSIVQQDITIYYDNLNFLRPKVITDKALIRPNSVYRQRSEESTLSLFRALPSLSRAEIAYNERIEQDTSLLDCDIFISPADNHSLQTGLSGTNKAGDLGLAFDLNYSNQNMFNGSELFSVSLKAAYEFVASNDPKYRNFYEIGITPAFTFSDIHLPFIGSYIKDHFNAETRYSLGFDLQKRPQYARNFFNFKWQFSWASRNNILSQTFSLLDVNYVSMPWMSDEFKRFMNTRLGPVSRYSFQDVFTAGSAYSLIYTNTNTGKAGQRLYTVRFNFESSGNALNAILSLKNKDTNETESRIYDVFGNPYAQYVKGDIDLSQTMPLTDNSNFALHAGFGVAYPYKNSSILPFEKRYYAGGPNSVRGWHTRFLGPGTMTVESDDDISSHTGDINLILSAEYRFKALTWLEPAFFVDCGNIWTARDYFDQPGGMFHWDSFYKELALGTGIGLRFDLAGFLIVRIDAGTRVYDPVKPSGERYVFLKNGILNKSALYFAIGYPF